MHDSLLEHVIALAEEDTPIEAEVTLIVGGLLVTGQVIGHDAYMAHHPLTKAFLEASLDDEGEVDGSEEADGDDVDEDGDEDEDFDDEGAYVHLRDARCHAPGQAPAGNGAFYRIALSDVSGFSLAR